MNFFRALFGGGKSKTEEKPKESKNFDVLKYDGVRALKQHQFDYAVQCFVHALQMKADDLECRDYLSQAYIAVGDLSQAYEQLQYIADACPDNVAVLLRLADVAYMMENYTAMADVAEKALLVDGDNVQVYYYYAKACRGLGDLTNAVAMLTKALKLDEEFDTARLFRGEVLLEKGETDEANEDADILLARIEGNEDVCLLKARVLKAKGDAADAEKMYDKVLEANPFRIEAFAERAIVRREQGNEDGANEDEATAEEMRASAPQADEGIEQKIKEKMQQADPYKVFNND